ncbi:MAG: TadE family protein [Hyalangium sp.]|uniref:TadE family protein n=1 Tax=Hyalangium sp. TaxID=2028555 RepID=UPI003899C550
MQQASHHGERGQAAVETAIVLPLLVFMLLGVLQMSIAYQTRLLSEYAAYKVARSASVYRLDCDHMIGAGLMALVPSVSLGQLFPDTKAGMRQRFVATARTLIGDNRPPNRGVNIPLIRVHYWVSGYTGLPFDQQLEQDEEPMKVHVRLAYFFEYRIPFANWIISRVWLASQTGQAWATGADPITPVRRTAGRVTRATEASLDVDIVRQALQSNYFTVPLVSTWSMRMMSDPIDGNTSGICPP